MFKDSSYEYQAKRPQRTWNPAPVWTGPYIRFEVPRVSMPSLRNNIHEIWSHITHKHWFLGRLVRPAGRWPIYEVLLPAMKLASLWLTRPEYQTFWTTIHSSPCKLNEERDNWSLEGAKATTPPPAEVQKALEKQLMEIGKKIYFCFNPLGHTNGRWTNKKAISLRNSDSWRGNSFKSGYVTILDGEFAAVDWPSGPYDNPVSMDPKIPATLGLLFLFAVHLSGQLAEVLWLDRRYRESGEEDGTVEDQSVTMDGVRYDCMSDAFEGVFFGGRVKERPEHPRYQLVVHRGDKGPSYSGPDTLNMTTREISQAFSSASWAMMEGKR